MYIKVIIAIGCLALLVMIIITLSLRNFRSKSKH
jgi:hypothetical protein